MTCIVAVKDEKSRQIIFGADSAIMDDDSQYIMSQNKLFKCGDEIMGCAGDIRALNILGSGWTMPQYNPNESINKYINIDVINSIRDALSDGGYTEKYNDKEQIESNFIFTFLDKIYVVEPNFGVWSPADSWVSIGSGSELATAAMFISHKTKNSIKKHATNGLEAAVKYSLGIQNPFNFLDKKY